MNKPVVEATERDQILKHIVGQPLAVGDVVDVATTVGHPTPSTAMTVSVVDGAPYVYRQTLIGHGDRPCV